MEQERKEGDFTSLLSSFRKICASPGCYYYFFLKVPSLGDL